MNDRRTICQRDHFENVAISDDSRVETCHPKTVRNKPRSKKATWYVRGLRSIGGACTASFNPKVVKTVITMSQISTVNSKLPGLQFLRGQFIG